MSSELHDFAITTWDVDPEALQSHLPEPLEADAFTLEDGRRRAFVSAVSFVNRRFFVGFAPFVKLTCAQTNYRAYVRCGSERAVWFFATSLGTPFVFVPRHVWGLPWHRSRVVAEAAWTDAGLQTLRWQGTSALGEERLDLRGTGAPLGTLDGFTDDEETQSVLTHPLVGYLYRRRETVVTYSVWHAPLVMENAEPASCRYEHYERLGLVERGQAPHSVLVQRRTDYLIQLPPRRP